MPQLQVHSHADQAFDEVLQYLILLLMERKALQAEEFNYHTQLPQ